jgi:hypothetical protein
MTEPYSIKTELTSQLISAIASSPSIMITLPPDIPDDSKQKN